MGVPCNFVLFQKIRRRTDGRKDRIADTIDHAIQQGADEKHEDDHKEGQRKKEPSDGSGHSIMHNTYAEKKLTIIVEITGLVANASREESVGVLDRLEPQCNYHLYEDRERLWPFSFLLYLGCTVASGAEERRRHFQAEGRVRQARRSIDWPASRQFPKFEMVRQIVTAIKIPRSTVSDHLTGWNDTV
jgi:hypothetical protein